MKLINKLILSENEFLIFFKEKVDTREPLLITYLNAHCYNVYCESYNYELVLNDRFTVYPDGIGIWLLLRKLGKKYSRFNATDLNYKLVQLIIELKKKVLIIGGDFDPKLIKKKCESKGMVLVSYINGFTTEDEIISNFLEINADVVFVGMGVPKQELLAYKLIQLKSEVKIICVGNFFNFYFDFQKRAPFVIRKIGLEWLFRLIIEPRKLFYRYTVGNIKFLIRLIIKR